MHRLEDRLSTEVLQLTLILTRHDRGRHNIPRPLQVDVCPLDLESCVRVTCDAYYLCANFSSDVIKTFLKTKIKTKTLIARPRL